MHQFRMYGRIVEVYRYQVSYIREVPNENGEIQPIPVTDYYPTQEEAQVIAERTGGTVTPLDSSDYAWMDGIEVADVPDTYAEAIKIYEMGQEAYERKLAFEAAKEADKLRADLDYIMLMGGL